MTDCDANDELLPCWLVAHSMHDANGACTNREQPNCTLSYHMPPCSGQTSATEGNDDDDRRSLDGKAIDALADREVHALLP